MVQFVRFQGGSVHHVPNPCENAIVRKLIGSVQLLRVSRYPFPPSDDAIQFANAAKAVVS